MIRPGLECTGGVNEVESVPQPPGSFRLATEDDTEALVPFVAGFAAAVDEPMDAQKSTEARIAKRNLFVWEDGEPVCCANVSDLTPNGVRLNR